MCLCVMRRVSPAVHKGRQEVRVCDGLRASFCPVYPRHQSPLAPTLSSNISPQIGTLMERTIGSVFQCRVIKKSEHKARNSKEVRALCCKVKSSPVSTYSRRFMAYRLHTAAAMVWEKRGLAFRLALCNGEIKINLGTECWRQPWICH